MLNDYNKKRFGWNTRTEGLFTSKSKVDVNNWGKPEIIFPIGEFKYVWSNNSEQLYELYDKWDYIHKKDYIWKGIKREIDEYYFNKRLDVYLKRETGVVSECIINGKEYYRINYEWYNTLLKYYQSDKYK